MHAPWAAGRTRCPDRGLAPGHRPGGGRPRRAPVQRADRRELAGAGAGGGHPPLQRAAGPGPLQVRVLDSGGRVVAGGPARPVPGQPLELRVPTAGLAAGGYTVSWRIVSAVDGHGTDGVFGFGVGPARCPGAAAVPGRWPRPRPFTGPQPVAVAGRWAWYWGLTLLVGAAATVLLVFGGRLAGRPGPLLGLALAARGRRPGRDDRDRQDRRRGGPRRPCSAPPPAAGCSGGRPCSLGPGPPPGGCCWPARRPAAIFFFFPPPTGHRGPLLALGLAGGAGMLVHALAGHAAGPSSLHPLNLLAQWAHLAAVGVWIGGLVWLLSVSPGSPRRRRVDAGRWRCGSPSSPGPAWPWWWSPG